MSNDLFKFPKRQANKITIQNGAVTLTQRNDVASATWSYRFTLPDGTIERRSTRTNDLQQAIKIATDRYLEVQWRAERKLSYNPVTFAQAATSLLEHLKREQQRQFKSSRLVHIQKLETYLMPSMGHLELSLLAPKDIDDLMRSYEDQWLRNKDIKRPRVVARNRKGELYDTPRVYMSKGTSTKPPSALSRKSFEVIVRWVVEHAVRQRMLTREEMPLIEVTAVKVPRRGAFDEDEETRLLNRLEQRISEVSDPNHISSRRLLWLWTRFHLLTGLRPGEESKDLRFVDVEFKGNATPHYILHVRKGKRGSRKVIVSTALQEVMRLLREHHPDYKPTAYLWVRQDGTKINTFRDVFMQVLEELGMLTCDDGKKRTPYSLRHTHVTRAIMRGVNISALAKNLGTSPHHITATYDHALHTQQVDSILGGSGGK
ncbi:tyrosine-type recombinase/integrase [Paracraurococcus lichenis]|uniref:Tyrosine-type recombinase/integrase n=1 Tax=Paracraurococcus lichenis TaxID=3064888 RepID=A0ABT9E4G4_9PROT|nr:tyrosine-type recombinase/integrase [Paracraurococcus sp. LOR1-02]MDO9711029.1 tyrosine-type recombinase/integrase [Paracraurococcus sp. LOR1-02]